MKFFLVTLLTLFLLLINTQKVSAGITSTMKLENPPPASKTAGSCAGTSYCQDIGTCVNQEAAGIADASCGIPCAVGGNPFGEAWTKYKFSGCYLTIPDLFGNQECVSYYPPTPDLVCSVADKCTSISSNPYLKAGSCDCTVGGVYKTCCTNTSPSFVTTNSCVQISVDKINPPYEGVCPAGTTAKFCGFGGYPACGQPACGPAAPACTNCDSGVSCSSTCTPSASNTCSAGNGTKSCTYTTCSVGGTCTPAAAPDQTCTIDNCSAGYTCVGGTCTANGTPTASLTPSCPSSTPTLSASWDVGTGSCNVYIRAGSSDYTISSNCSGSWTGTSLPGGPAIVNGGTYNLYADNTATSANPDAQDLSKTVTCAGATPPPTASPTTPPSYDQPCGSCPNGGGGCPSGQTTCYAGGINMGCRPLYSCFVDAGNVCQWDPTNCTNNPPGGGGAYGQCFQMDIVPYWGLCNTYYKLYGDPSTYPSDCLGTEPPTQAGKNCLSEVRYEYACDGGSCHLPDPPYPGGNCTPEKNCNGDIACPATPVTSCSCDPQCDSQAFMSFDPASPQLNQPFTIKVTSTIGYQNVKLTGTDPTGSTTFFNYAGVSGGSGGNPYIWKWTVQKALGGKYSFVFGVNQGTACGGNSSDGVGTNYNCATQTFTLNVLPWIQVVGGDVHSNSGINVSGGP